MALHPLYAFPYMLLHELKQRLFGTRYYAEVDVTDNCNLRCKHCYHFHGRGRFKKQEVPLKVWEQRFDGLHKAGIRVVLLVGGEPSLRPDVLEAADKRFPLVYVITNGTIPIPRQRDIILFVSVDGSKERNDAIRGKGVFERVMKNYSGDPRVVINMTITKDNYKELESVIKIAKENGFRGVVCNIYTPTIGEKSALFIEPEARKKIIAEFKRVKSLYPHDFLLNPEMIRWYEFPDHRRGCWWGDKASHFTVSWKKRRCFANYDCSNCGCFAGSLQGTPTLMKHPFETIKLI